MTILNADAASLPKIGVAHFSFNPRPNVQALLPLLDNVGAQTVRIEVPWAETETVLGQYAIPSYEGWLIAELKASGRQVVILCDYGNPLYPGSGAYNLPPRDAASCQGFANYVGFVASKYPWAVIEAYNEPNNPTFWGGAVNPTQFAALLSPTINTVRALPNIGSTIQLIPAGVGSALAQDDQNPFMASVAATIGATAMNKLSAQTLHPYDQFNPPEALLGFISRYRAAVPYPSGLIAITEWGYTSAWINNDETKRSLYLARMICSAILAGASILNVFCLRDTGTDPNNPENNFGLHKMDGTPKPAASVMKNMIAALAGTITYDAEVIPVVGGNNYRITLRKAGVVTKIIWSDAPITSIVEPMATVQNVTDSNGGRPWFRFQPAGIMITVGPAIAPQIITGTV